MTWSTHRIILSFPLDPKMAEQTIRIQFDHLSRIHSLNVPLELVQIRVTRTDGDVLAQWCSTPTLNCYGLSHRLWEFGTTALVEVRWVGIDGVKPKPTGSHPTLEAVVDYARTPRNFVMASSEDHSSQLMAQYKWLYQAWHIPWVEPLEAPKPRAPVYAVPVPVEPRPVRAPDFGEPAEFVLFGWLFDILQRWGLILKTLRDRLTG